MKKQYDPSLVEENIYKLWLDKKSFSADEMSKKKAYSIVIPPPNITGILHMGHALNNTVQDILIRYKRMNGFETLWLPGTDHAGIATQNVVERRLAKEGMNRHELGREVFVKEVWKWKEHYQSTIINQLIKLGVSCDWDRERFTMDEGLSAAVRRVFFKLYHDGLIYRGKYIINWCPRCRTALSDEEAVHREVKGKLWYFNYPFAEGKGSVMVATTRPETMLGDTAVAVNPSDERYKALIGKKVILPLANREIPVIADDFVDKEFGTGAVKVTPAHDPNDFLIGQRHAMEPVVVIDEGGIMCGDIPEKYIGLDRFNCRKKIVEDMGKEGLLDTIENHFHAVGHCYRCDTIVEPYYSDQWFVKMKPLAEKALKPVYDGTIKLFPPRWRKTYLEWMENIRDWCISRQIWWGHRIPVWYCNECNEIIVADETPKKCSKCNATSLRQDEDVLDTWFSSWLWPFSTMGWPENTPLMNKFYPTNTLVTAPEILFFWVARMIMAGLYCTGSIPFSDVVLHGTVRDKSGSKMSKSLGNAIDPLEIISQYGADALRLSMIMITAQGADVFLEKDTFDIGRNFANKLWNASRFLLGNIKEPQSFSELPESKTFKAEDTWILSRLNRSIENVRKAIDSYRLNEACHAIYDFTWHDFCDWYVEAKKADLYQNDDPARKENALNLCSYVLAQILKLLHPVMPYITEEIWQHLQKKISYPLVIDNDTIVRASYPEIDKSSINGDIEKELGLLKEIIITLRTIRAENNVPPDKKGRALIMPIDEKSSSWLFSQTHLINMFAHLEKTTVDSKAKKPEFAGRSVVKGNQVFLELEGLIDRNVEIERLSKEIDRMERMAEGIKKQLENDNFINKAPETVVTKEKKKYNGILLNLEKLQKNLKELKG